MSYSICLNCREMVPRYDKYCAVCQKRLGLPNLPLFQKTWKPRDFDSDAKREVEKDLHLMLPEKEAE